jgi:atrazine chlorohydrolase/5-methylthioadenosine/S-adenosylhomocysteine deaminase
MGLRTVYGAGLRDRPADEEFEALFESIATADRAASGPYPNVVETERGLDAIEGLVETHHDPAGRQSVWPAPATLSTTTPEALAGAYDIARRHDVMTTVHVAQTAASVHGDGLSCIEYLRNVGALGERALLGHCVRTSQRDLRILAETGTNVAHNFRANMRTATGFAPVVGMFDGAVSR